MSNALPASAERLPLRQIRITGAQPSCASHSTAEQQLADLGDEVGVDVPIRFIDPCDVDGRWDGRQKEFHGRPDVDQQGARIVLQYLPSLFGDNSAGSFFVHGDFRMDPALSYDQYDRPDLGKIHTGYWMIQTVRSRPHLAARVVVSFRWQVAWALLSGACSTTSIDARNNARVNLRQFSLSWTMQAREQLVRRNVIETARSFMQMARVWVGRQLDMSNLIDDNGFGRTVVRCCNVVTA